MNSLFLALINTKSEVIVSSEFAENDLPDTIASNNVALLVKVVVEVLVASISRDWDIACGFNKTVPNSGNTNP